MCNVPNFWGTEVVMLGIGMGCYNLVHPLDRSVLQTAEAGLARWKTLRLRVVAPSGPFGLWGPAAHAAAAGGRRPPGGQDLLLVGADGARGVAAVQRQCRWPAGRYASVTGEGYDHEMRLLGMDRSSSRAQFILESPSETPIPLRKGTMWHNLIDRPKQFL